MTRIKLKDRILPTYTKGEEIFNMLSHGKYLQTFDQEPPTLDEIFKMKAGEENE